MTIYEALMYDMTIDKMAKFIAEIQVREKESTVALPPDFDTVENITKLQKKWLESEVEENKITNYEKIKQMSVEELAYLINYILGCCRTKECYRCPIKDTSHHFQSCGKRDVKEWLNKEWEVE